MSRKIIGVTVGTPISPSKIEKELKPVKTINGTGPDGKGNVAINLPTKLSQLENDKGYLTEHQDISGKLDANKLPEAINTALVQAKASGEFDGADGINGEDGVSPTVTVSTITGGHRIKITDASGTKSVDVMDGMTGDPGEDGKDGRGIVSITRTAGSGAAGTVDTYTIAYTDNTTSTFTVYNGANGKDGTGGTGGGGTGADGKDGATFTPYVDANGNLSWSNDKGLANPDTVNIRGPRGETGADGKDGQNGSPGKDGTSATHSWNGTTLTITSASGTSSANLKGATGESGYSPVRGKDYWTSADIAEIKSYVDDAILGGAW